jgi:transposase
MFRWISILGGLLIMMGQHDRSEALFHYFRYSEMDRPSIDPELLLRILLIGYLYGITSKRKLVEELCMHLAWRWFTGLGFDQEIPHHLFRSPSLGSSIC